MQEVSERLAPGYASIQGSGAVLKSYSASCSRFYAPVRHLQLTVAA